MAFPTSELFTVTTGKTWSFPYVLERVFGCMLTPNMNWIHFLQVS